MPWQDVKGRCSLSLPPPQDWIHNFSKCFSTGTRDSNFSWHYPGKQHDFCSCRTTGSKVQTGIFSLDYRVHTAWCGCPLCSPTWRWHWECLNNSEAGPHLLQSSERAEILFGRLEVHCWSGLDPWAEFGTVFAGFGITPVWWHRSDLGPYSPTCQSCWKPANRISLPSFLLSGEVYFSAALQETFQSYPGRVSS